MKYGNRRRTQNGNEDLVILALAFLIGLITDNSKPQEYEYKSQIVVVDKNYLCPKYCGVKHNHHAYFNSDTGGIIIDKISDIIS